MPNMDEMCTKFSSIQTPYLHIAEDKFFLWQLQLQNEELISP